MPQYMLSVHHGDEVPFPEGVEPGDVFAAVGEFNDKLQKDGRLIFAGGLMPASHATVAHRDGTTTTGPRLTGDEYLGGFWIVEAADDDAALALAREAVTTGCSPTIEVRPLQGE